MVARHALGQDLGSFSLCFPGAMRCHHVTTHTVGVKAMKVTGPGDGGLNLQYSTPSCLFETRFCVAQANLKLTVAEASLEFV